MQVIIKSMAAFLGDIDACFETPLEEQMPPTPQASAGNANALFEEAVFPCNICVGFINEATGYDENGEYHQYKPRVELSNIADFYDNSNLMNSWTCNTPDKIGCHDLCRWDKYLKRQVVAKSANEIWEYKEGEYPKVRCNAAIIK